MSAAIIAVVLLIVVVVAGLGYYLYTQSQKSKDTPSTAPMAADTGTTPIPTDQSMYSPSSSGTTPSSSGTTSSSGTPSSASAPPSFSSPAYVLIGVGTDNNLYTKTSATDPWTAAVQAKSGDTIRFASQANDGTLLAVGTDYKLYTRASITDKNASYKPVQMDDPGWQFRELHQRIDGTYFALGMDGRTCASVGDISKFTNQGSTGWGSFCCLDGVNLSAKDPTMLIGVNGNGELWAKKYNNQNQGDGDWGPTNTNRIITGLNPAMISATQMADGTYICIGRDNKTYYSKNIPLSNATAIVPTADTRPMLSLANWDSTKVQPPQAPTTTSSYAPEPINADFYDYMGIVQ